ncbi:hypothetical protein Trydic_g3846, partial [Trypoxylus dichotomus]
MKLWKVNSTQTMKATPAKKGKFSLRKEKNPEFVEDEFLEISKINMTEELNVSQPSVNKKHDVPNDECNSTIDMSSDNSNAIDYLINEDINDIEEQEILNNITSDSSIFDSDSDHSIFSCDTVILSDKENKSKNIKHGSKSASASVKVYRFIIQVAKEAESEIEVTEKEYELNTIINKLTLTLGFSNKIIEQLSNYTQVLVNDIKLQTLNPPVTKKEPSPKRSKLSLKKEKDPEFTQDEFLEIYKIDMTEDLNAPYSSVNERHDASSDRSNSISDKSDNDSNVTDDLINEDIKDEDEQDILNNITCDSSIFGSDSEHSLFSIDTVILSQNEDDTKNVEYRIGQSKSNNDKAELLDIENKDEVISNDLQLKECYVVLSDCEKRRKSKEKLSDLVKELRSIENLVNLDNLNRKRKLDEENIEHNRLKKKRQANDKSDNDNSDQNDSNSDQNDSN